MEEPMEVMKTALRSRFKRNTFYLVTFIKDNGLVYLRKYRKDHLGLVGRKILYNAQIHRPFSENSC